MTWEDIISKKYSEDTLFMTFDNLEELVEAMLKNNIMNAKSLDCSVLTPLEQSASVRQ